MVTVLVSDQSKLDSNIRAFRKKVQKEGIIKEARMRKEYEKPSVKRKRKEEESASRGKKKRKKM